MKLSENVEIKTDEVETTDSRASRMARYSAAAAGVAAVSSTEVDAALVTVDLGSPVGQYTPIDISSASSIDPTSFGAGEGGPFGSDFTLIFYTSYEGPSGLIAAGSVAAGSVAALGSQAITGKWFGPNEQIGPLQSGWEAGGIIGPALDNQTAYMGFRVPDGSSVSSYTYGYLQFDFDSLQNATVQYWGYESVINTAVTTAPGVSSSSVADTGPGVVGLALLGAGAAGMRLLRKLRAGK